MTTFDQLVTLVSMASRLSTSCTDTACTQLTEIEEDDQSSRLFLMPSPQKDRHLFPSRVPKLALVYVSIAMPDRIEHELVDDEPTADGRLRAQQ